MKIPSLLKFSPFLVTVAAGTWIGNNLRKHDGALAVVEREPILDTKPIFSQRGTCEKSADCEDGCFCGVGLCKHYGGVDDARCKGVKNGHDLGDGGFCWDGRRDKYCAARDPNSNSGIAMRVPEALPQASAKRTADKPKTKTETEESDAPIADAMAQAEKDTDKTIEKAGKMDPADMFWDDIRMFFDYLMPGKRPNIAKKFTELSVVGLAVLWFVIYRIWLYEDDRCPAMWRWENLEIESGRAADDPRIKLMKPDLVLVFHRPDFDCGDLDTDVDANVLDTAIVGKKGNLPRSESLLTHALKHHAKTSLIGKIAQQAQKAKKAADAVSQAVTDKAKAAADKVNIRRRSMAAGKAAAPNEDDAASDDDDDDDATDAAGSPRYSAIKLGAFRTALLQDICEHLPQQGFDVAAFTSVDKDEIFVCISLRNQHTIKQHLQRYGMKLQLKQEMVKALGIAQDPDEVESSPPYIGYDRRLAENVFGKGQTDLDIFINWGAHTGNPMIISGIDRIRIIHKHLNANVNLDYAVSKGLFVQWYPAHAEARIKELSKGWARWSLLTDLTVRQPLTAVRNYFGSRVAFIFGWMGLYAKMLLCLLPVGVLWSLLNFVMRYYVGENEWWHRGSVFGISIAIIIWAKVAYNLWKQEEEFLVAYWDLKHVGLVKQERPDFYGVRTPDEADSNKHSLQYPAWKYQLRMTISWLITLAFCIFVFSCMVIWLNVFNGRLSLSGSIIQAIMIQVFTLTYNWMAEALTLAENHKYQDNFYTSYLKKMFIFQLVNQYSGFIYMAVKQQYMKGGCPNDDCVVLIQDALPITLLVLALLQFVAVFVGTIKVKIALWLESRAMVAGGLEPPVYSFVEEQSKYGQFRVREQIEVMTQLSLILGYILIFGCVAPRIVPLCALVFMIQIRAAGVLMTTAVHRTVPRVTVGIGEWNAVFYGLMVLGVLFSAYLLVQFAPLFKGTCLISKVSGAGLYVLFIGFLWVVVDIVVPAHDSSSDKLDGRRRLVEHRVMQIHEDKNFEGGEIDHSKDKSTVNLLGNKFHTDAVVAGDWADVPRLIPTEEGEKAHFSSNEVVDE